ncbi:hypothetical protein [Peribacillus sp. V2I11]|uniref:hypothetical protein n=1 Tax=Peribacillus sp. V2I11 TaxID=3042277 RepID=UPI00277D483F|nr:hypothetical protein [Peribacillus sp. V2I11]MDQ0879150.1 hypothetical protein [Peribacillus sp. V2I11]
MSQEWKMKLHSVYGQLLFDRKLTERFNKNLGYVFFIHLFLLFEQTLTNFILQFIQVFLVELPQYDSYISQMLPYSQDFITLEDTLTVKSDELRLL